MHGTVPGTCTPVDSARHDQGVELLVRSMNCASAQRKAAAAATRVSCSMTLRLTAQGSTRQYGAFCRLLLAGITAATNERAGPSEKSIQSARRPAWSHHRPRHGQQRSTEKATNQRVHRGPCSGKPFATESHAITSCTCQTFQLLLSMGSHNITMSYNYLSGHHSQGPRVLVTRRHFASLEPLSTAWMCQ